jgi:metal-sulfur cluster biosynthetic enzyme
VNDVHVAVTWDPPWDKSMMSEVAQLELDGCSAKIHSIYPIKNKEP